uniref:Endonuclease/exonuclease/phosphatase domain-containing protein n=1 Tax=Cyclopterus lumpus TaxID=8103 RepID=A0A8C2W990_CYCLU
MVRAEIEGSVYCFANIYAPNQGLDRARLFTMLQSELQSCQQEQLIIGGDFNCTLDFPIDRNSEEPHPQSAQSLHHVITQLDLLDTWRVKDPQYREYTWVMVHSHQTFCDFFT